MIITSFKNKKRPQHHAEAFFYKYKFKNSENNTLYLFLDKKDAE
jgi:hypothetical protein